MDYENERDACEAWVRGFHAIPVALLERAYEYDTDALALVAGGERVSNCCHAQIDPRSDDDGETVPFCSDCERECDPHWRGARHGWPSSHGELYHPNEPLDASWARSHAEEIAETCGLLVYESDETGVLLAVDGAGYDFYARHWLPLYRLRGLEWHK